MPRTTKKISKQSSTDVELLSDERIGPEAIGQMQAEVNEWTNSIQKRFSHLGNYVNTLESMNTRLEARTDRSLALAEVFRYCGLRILIVLIFRK